MINTAIIQAYEAANATGKGGRRRPAPFAITPGEAVREDLRHMSQDEVNKAIASMENQFAAEDRIRELFSGRVAKMYAAVRRFRYIDLFCGAGGSSTGLTMAGGQLMLALNHSMRNIITHSTNFPGAEHDCVDINRYDMRNLPRGFEVLWVSPICTEISPAGGNSSDGQPGEEVPDELLKYGPVDKDTFQRTRATAYDVIRACEVHMPPIVIVENVIEFVTRWKLFAWWLMGMAMLGYEFQIVSANSAHLEGPDGETAPQSRDRLYIMFNRRDVARPDVRVRPRSHCGNCGEVRGVQTWKEPEGYDTESGKKFLVGKYGIRSGQYYFTCPDCTEIVQPITKPAASVINFHFLGERIGDRKKPLVDNSRKRIGRGLIEIGIPQQRPFLDANGGSWNTGTASVDQPFRTRTTKDWEALCVPPGAFIDTVRNHAVPTSVFDPLTTIAAGGNHQGLVIPYNKGSVPFPADTQPFNTFTTRDRQALLTGWDGASLDELIDNSKYRMIQWYEQLLAQAFPLDYLMTGNIGERTAGAGNAVSANAAGFFGMAAADALERTTAAPARPRRRAKTAAGSR